MPYQLPPSIVTILASREMRLHHYLWHEIRENWNSYTAEQQQEVRQLGWEPPRPARKSKSDGYDWILDNNAGEDFFFMHREMIELINAELKKLSLPLISGWEQLPAPNDSEYPVPVYVQTGDTGRDAYLERVKKESFYSETMRPLEEKFANDAELKKMQLGQLGAEVESTLHNYS
ncbi:MAG: Tat pathway signal protein, partial [Gammaproteobacteria bacterium]